jgi:hypothetical protein
MAIVGKLAIFNYVFFYWLTWLFTIIVFIEPTSIYDLIMVNKLTTTVIDRCWLILANKITIHRRMMMMDV